jgi:hypothetical protein
MEQIRLPNNSQRLSIYGATGSGKTQAALWHFSQRDFDKRPWIVYDFKGDESISLIPNAYELPVNSPIPTKPGIFIVHPAPDEAESVDAQMKEIWAKQDIGVYVDEGYMLQKNGAGMNRLLTQGRSRRIPMINLSQRPVWINRFILSESDFHQVFRLQHRGDVDAVQEFIPTKIFGSRREPERLPDFHSYYYDVGKNTMHTLQPVPSIDEILDHFYSRTAKLKKVV